MQSEGEVIEIPKDISLEMQPHIEKSGLCCNDFYEKIIKEYLDKNK